MEKLLLQFGVTFLPGLIWVAIAAALTGGQAKAKPFDTVLRAYGFGLASYLIWFLAYFPVFRCRWGVWPTVLGGANTHASVNALLSLSLGHVFGASLLSVGLGIVWSWAANRKLFLWLMHRLRVTRKFGNESLWDYTLSLRSASVEFVNVRDLENGLTYSGYVRAFSEGEIVRELLLEDVKVFTLPAGTFLYSMPLLYLSRKMDEFHVEFPYEVPKQVDALKRRRFVRSCWSKLQRRLNKHLKAASKPRADSTNEGLTE